jgi:hypothetical protein
MDDEVSSPMVEEMGERGVDIDELNGIDRERLCIDIFYRDYRRCRCAGDYRRQWLRISPNRQIDEALRDGEIGLRQVSGVHNESWTRCPTGVNECCK